MKTFSQFFFSNASAILRVASFDVLCCIFFGIKSCKEIVWHLHTLKYLVGFSVVSVLSSHALCHKKSTSSFRLTVS